MTKTDCNTMFNEIYARASRIYGFNQIVKFVIRDLGKTGGYAHRSMKLEINEQYLKHGDSNEIYETIIHEMAHLVCFDQPQLGKNHNAGWKRVCRTLGGNAERTHSMNFKPLRRTRQAVYDINGKTVKVGLIKHKRIQKSVEGRRYLMRACKTRILPEMFTGEIVIKG